MTILQNGEQPLSLQGTYPESNCCIDCGYNTHPGAPPRELAEFLMNRDGSFPVTITDDTELYIVNRGSRSHDKENFDRTSRMALGN